MDPSGWKTVEAGERGPASEQHSLSEAELRQGDVDSTAALQREVLGKIDADVLSSIEERNGQWIPSERWSAARESLPTALPRGEYEKRLQAQHGVPEEEAKRCLGHYSSAEDRVYITPAYPITRQVLAHERLHQLADPEGTAMLGQGLDEGITEWLARDAVGEPPFRDAPQVWEGLRRLAEMLHAHVGPERLRAAYFRGDVSDLEQAVDRACGDGAFHAVTALADRGEYVEAAERLRPKEAE